MEENNTTYEEKLTLRDTVDVKGHYDVVVIGGGVAGAAAAISAARQGKSTLLIEKTVLLGGLATTGYVVIYLPLCNGKGQKLIGGIAEEMLLASIKGSYHTLPALWQGSPKKIAGKSRYQTEFNGPLFAMRLDNMVVESGADILLDTLFCAVVKNDGRASHVVVENQDGRVAYGCNTIVDATGDARVFHHMAAPTTLGSNYLSYWTYYTDMKGIEAAALQGNVHKAVKIYTGGATCTGEGQPQGVETLHGVSAKDVNTMMMKGRALALKTLEEKPVGTMAYTGFSAMPQFRTTRMIQGDYGLCYEDNEGFFEDSIGCCGDWRHSGVAFELPYRSLTAPGIKNVIAAGRNIGCADSEAWEVTRVIPVAAQTGEAAGIAAALCPVGGDVHSINPKAVAKLMEESGHVIHLKDL